MIFKMQLIIKREKLHIILFLDDILHNIPFSFPIKRRPPLQQKSNMYAILDVVYEHI